MLARDAINHNRAELNHIHHQDIVHGSAPTHSTPITAETSAMSRASLQLEAKLSVRGGSSRKQGRADHRSAGIPHPSSIVALRCRAEAGILARVAWFGGVA